MSYLPGDELVLELTQKGQDSHQAVGYLHDGTMVVVEQAKKFIGQEKRVEIIRSLQTDAGKMMFAKLVVEPKTASRTKASNNSHSAVSSAAAAKSRSTGRRPQQSQSRKTKGDISLVGPRALVPHELSAYDKKHVLLAVKSGLTGLAVVSGRRSISFEERRRIDLYYVQNWSLWLDITILLKTCLVIFQKDN